MSKKKYLKKKNIQLGKFRNAMHILGKEIKRLESFYRRADKLSCMFKCLIRKNKCHEEPFYYPDGNQTQKPTCTWSM